MHTIAPTQPSLQSRPFAGDEDFWRIRGLAVATYPISGLGFNWDIRRWDGARFYDAKPAVNPAWYETMRLWETGAGTLAGLALADGEGWFSLQIHPDYRPWIEEDMIAWAEDCLAKTDPETGRRQIETDVFEYDAPRRRILTGRGYEKMPYGGVIRRMWLGSRPLPAADPVAGYTLRALRGADPEDCQRLADLLNAAFGRTFHNPGEMLSFSRLAPCYRADLHRVAVAPDGSFAAHVGAIYDEDNRRGFYEPVCTHPDHRRKNLAQALMVELLHRLKALGAAEVTVETGDAVAANAFYDAFGFTEAYKSYAWKKVW